MAGLALLARVAGRVYDVERALLLTAVLMILFNPFILVFDASFQLSFIGTFAIVFYAPRIEKYFSSIPNWLGLREIVLMTAAIYIFVFPFILYKMGTFSLVTLPANILIMPFFPLTIFLGFITGFIGLFSNPLAYPFAYLSYFLLHYQLSVIGWLASLPFASFTIPNFSLFITLLIYAYFIYALFRERIKEFFLEKF